MSETVAVRIHQVGKIAYYDATGIPCKIGDLVVIKGGHGLEVAPVVSMIQDFAGGKEDLRAVLRKAQAEDLEQLRKSREKEKEAIDRCRKLVAELNLKMKPVASQSNLEGNHITVFFAAEERVDFRELVKRLGRSLETKIEMKQLGPRDEAKIIGGIGRCGLPLCCGTFLSEFTPVSIRMAKSQDLSLNPTKISGACGRLLCCLSYENELYQAAKSKLPKIGQKVSTPLGVAKLAAVNVLKETGLAETETGAIVEFPLSQLLWEEKESKTEGKPEKGKAFIQKGRPPES